MALRKTNFQETSRWCDVKEACPRHVQMMPYYCSLTDPSTLMRAIIFTEP